MTHANHPSLPGYSPGQILHDGCDECEARAAVAPHGIFELDNERFERAWQRAAAWQRMGLPDISDAEAPLLLALWAVQVRLENRGVPIGEVPAGRSERSTT